jgi:polyphosphate glucokinase
MELLVSPDVIIIGGGVSKDHEKYFPYLQTKAKLIPAQFLNQAGIVGAALYAKMRSRSEF